MLCILPRSSRSQFLAEAQTGPMLLNVRRTVTHPIHVVPITWNQTLIPLFFRELRFNLYCISKFLITQATAS